MWFNSSKKKKGRKIEPFFYCCCFFSSPIESFSCFRSFSIAGCEVLSVGRTENGRSRKISSFTYFQLHDVLLPHSTTSSSPPFCIMRQITKIQLCHGKRWVFRFSLFLPLCIWRRFIVLCRRWWSIIHVGGSIWRTKSSSEWQMSFSPHIASFDWLKKIRKCKLN